MVGCSILPPKGSVFDPDEDGWSYGDDCDESDPTVNPAAAERCDGIDNDCDGLTDEEDDDLGFPWFQDADSDGYGDPDMEVRRCDQAEGAVAQGGDCDDDNPEIHPGAQERCDEIDQDCDGETWEDDDIDASLWYGDGDGDGYGDPETATWSCDPIEGAVELGGDCLDEDASVHPGAEEYCDDIDQDCDGDTRDEDAIDVTTWYTDADGDGFGDDDISALSCDAPSGAVALGGDCDDTNVKVNPDAEEVCNAIDDNCDGEINEGPPEETVIWYPDVDGDGYGDPGSPTDACGPPEGYTELAGDCDDTESSVNPGEVEDCSTDYDDDCNLDTNEVDALNCTEFYEDSDGDGFGDDGAVTCLCEATSDRPTTVPGDCDDTRDDTYPGAEDLCFDGVVNDCDLTEAEAAALCTWDATTDLFDAEAVLIGEKEGDGAGSSLAAVGDLDGDGLDDLLVGAPLRDSGSSITDAGAAYVVSGPITGAISLGDYARLSGASADGEAGSAVAGGFDLDADGYGDVAVGAPSLNSDDGAAYVVLGPITSSLSLSSADATLTGDTDYFVGYSLVNAGDLSGDGQDDLVVGGPKGDAGYNDRGNVWVLFGPVSSAALATDYDAAFMGTAANEQAGTTSAAGDMNGDGVTDLWMCSPKRKGGGIARGSAFVVLGSITAGSVTDLNGADYIVSGVSDNDHLCTAIASGQDLDGDGVDDLLVSAPDADPNGSGSGAAWLVLGAYLADGAVDAVATATVEGAAEGDALGTWVDLAVDLTSPGSVHLLLGAPGNDDNGGDAGAIYAVDGLLSGTLDLATTSADYTFLGAAAGDNAGTRVAAVGDTDGNGYADLLVGSPGYDDTAGADIGAAQLLLNGKY